MIDLQRPLRTKGDKLLVTLLRTDVRGEFPLVGLKHTPTSDIPASWKANGQYTKSGAFHEDDLENVPEFRVTTPGIYRMRNGQEARVTLVTQSNGDVYPAHGMIGGLVCTWMLSGYCLCAHVPSPDDLVERLGDLPFKVTEIGLYRTAGGETARVTGITHNAWPRTYSIIGTVGSHPRSWLGDGTYTYGEASSLDLVERTGNLPKKFALTRWVNIWKSGDDYTIGRMHRTEADAREAHEPAARLGIPLVACMPMTLEGEEGA